MRQRVSQNTKLGVLASHSGTGLFNCNRPLASLHRLWPCAAESGKGLNWLSGGLQHSQKGSIGNAFSSLRAPKALR